jgi:hypothetical protein
MASGILFPSRTRTRTPVVPWTRCQLPFMTRVGHSSRFRVVVAWAGVALRVSGGG